jgi:Ca-activated chloride channel homolog
MNFNYQLTLVEYVFIISFLVLYALYIGRTAIVARAVGTPARAVVVKFFLRTIYVALFIVSLLGPSFGEAEADLIAEGKDIYVLVDISKSMDAVDVPPSRLEKVKFELQNLVNSLSNNRFGLIAFSTEAVVQVPLTFDRDALGLFIQSLSTGQHSATGTDLCRAVELATNRFMNIPFQQKSAKVILLMTDGEDFGNCDNQILAQLRQYGITLITIGVGTTRGGRIPEQKDWVRNSQGQVVVSKLRNEYLREITQKSKGQYFEINERSNPTAELTSAINALDNKLIDSRKVAVTSNKYRYFLVIALLFILFDVLAVVTTFQV